MMCCLKTFLVCCALAICAFGRSSSQNSSVCQPLPMGLEKLCGYRTMAEYEHLSHLDSAIRAVHSVSKLIGSCSPYANLIICSVYIPRCVSDIEGPYLPCRRVCDEFNNKCGEKIRKYGMEWIIGMCQLLPVKDDPKTSLGYLGRCFEPPNFKTNITINSKPQSLKCYPLVIPICQNIGYKYTVLNTHKQKAYISYANRKLSAPPKDNSTVDCPLARKRFFCTENFPACIDNSSVAFYCRRRCEDFFHRNCSSPFFYQRDMCMEFPIGSSPVDICKQTHWPRAQNWPSVKRSSVMTTDTPTDSVSNIEPHHPTNKPSDCVLNIPPHPTNKSSGPKVVQAKLSKKSSKSSATPVTGGVLGAVCVIALVVVIAYVIYRKKRQTTIPYDKQILYDADESVEI